MNLNTIDPSLIQQDYIQKREYEALLFGEILGADPDPFAFWHSSLKNDPGLNLALYDNQKADKLLEEARQAIDPEVRSENYQEFQELVAEDIPALFLYSPYYLYPVREDIKGINLERIPLPSWRFSHIEDWYIKNNRIKK
mgnify:FL=1